MINVSTDFKRSVFNGNNNFLIRLSITLQDGTKLEVKNDNIMSNGLLVDDAVSDDEDFTALGSTIINACDVILYNNDNVYSDYEFKNAVITVYIGLNLNDTIEEFKRGVFTVDDAVYGDVTITLSLLDNMAQFDRPYSESSLTYPATLLDIVRDACSVCDVTLATNSLNFPHNTFNVATRPSEESTTFREVIGWAATIAGCFARCNTLGELEFSWFDVTSLEVHNTEYDGGTFNPWTAGNVVDGGSFTDWSGTIIDGGSFQVSDNVHYINALRSQSLGVDDVVITGVRISVDIDDPEVDEDIVQITAGTDDYLIEIEDNKFITVENMNTVLNWLSTQLIGLRFRKCNIETLGNPIIEAGDVALIWDSKGVEHPILVTRATFSPTALQEIVCGAAQVARNSAVRFSSQTKSYVAMRKQLRQQRETYSAALADLSDRVENASGLHKTEVEQQDGSIITYYHNKPKLADSDIQIIISNVGITVTSNGTDEHPIWYGLEVNGNLIASIMRTIGINFDWGVGGELIITKDNKETLYVNAATGEVRINATSFSLTNGDTIDSIAQGKANDALQNANSYTDTAKQDAISTATNNAVTSANSYTDSQINSYSAEVNAIVANLQDQIDGQIESWYYDYKPELTNFPASNWTTESDKKSHEGDMFYWESTGYAYRFMKNSSGTWEWKLIEDSQITKAIQTAYKAQETADRKKRIFVVTPTPPYDVGDLWVQGSTGEILKCKIAKTDTDSYSANDWDKASKYTDDSAFTAFRDGTYASFVTSTNTAISKKVTTFYQASQPTATATGDLWIDTDDGNSLHRWDGSKWISIQDTAIQSALTAASNAQTTADGKIVTFAQADQPTATDKGDLWIDTDDNNKLYRWSGSSWVAVTDSSAVVELEIGGKNKLTGTNSTTALTATGYWADRTWRKAGGGTGTITHVDITDCPDKSIVNGWQIDVTSVSSTAFGQSVAIGQNRIKIISEQQYTISCYAKGSGQLFMFCGISSYSGTKIDVTSEWKRYSYTFTAGTTSAYVADTGANVFFGASTNGASITICGMQLESGNKASAWNPAPEDFDAKIDTLKSYADSLQTQVDGKAETFYQDNDPSTNWSAEEKIIHEGDLWYNTSTGKTYRYSGSIWQQQNVPNEVFDRIDGKARVFITQPTPPYDEGDLWVQGSNGDIMRCKTSRASGSYTASEWEKASKYTDDSAVTALNNALTQQEVFNRLTNNGQIQGIYLKNGLLYINATYIQGGTLKLGGLNDANGLLEVYDKSGNKIGSWDKDGANIQGNIESTWYYINKFYPVATINQEGILVRSYLYLPKETPDMFIDLRAKVLGGMGIKKNLDGTGKMVALTTSSVVVKDNDMAVEDNLDVFTYPATRMTTNEFSIVINEVGAADHYAFYVNKNGDGMFKGQVFIKNLSVTGTKSRIVDTNNYNTRSLYCYETPTPLFGDIGEAVLDSNGICYVDIDDIFSETIDTKIEYQVFLQKEGEGDCYVAEKQRNYFAIKGTPNLKVAWELKAKQRDYTMHRLEEYGNDYEEYADVDAFKLYDSYIKEQEDILNETIS